MIARLRIALPIGVIAWVVALFVVTVVIPDPSATALSFITVGAITIGLLFAMYVQRRRGLRSGEGRVPPTPEA